MWTAKFNHICWALHLFSKPRAWRGGRRWWWWRWEQLQLKSNGFWLSSSLIKFLVLSAPAHTHTCTFPPFFLESRQQLISHRSDRSLTFGLGVRTCSTLTLNSAAAGQTEVYEQMLWDYMTPDKSHCALQQQHPSNNIPAAGNPCFNSSSHCSPKIWHWIWMLCCCRTDWTSFL